ncbi:unnamed protein product, partial [Adineta steineri]
MIFIIICILFFQQLQNDRVLAAIANVSADLELIRVNHNMPGLSALAFKNGSIVAQGASGYRRLGNPTPLLVTDRINLGSNSKWMTATVAGRLVDQNAFRNATLEQFLAHRSGVQQSTTFYSRYYDALLAQKGTFCQIRYWVTETVLKDVPEVQPGEFLYANQGYAVAAAMMEQITGRDWESLVQEHVFTALQMTSATIGVVYDDIIPPKTPVGHDLAPNKTIPVPRPLPSSIFLRNDQAATGPAGYIACTMQDWVKF